MNVLSKLVILKYLLLCLLILFTPTVEALAPREPENRQIEILIEQPTLCNDSSIKCNCYLFVKSLIPNLPLTKDLYPNSPPKIGSVALFTYSNGLRHYAYVIGLYGANFTVRECNFKKGVCGERGVSYDDPALDGWWFTNPSL